MDSSSIMSVNYDSRVVNTSKFLIFTTLKTYITSVGGFIRLATVEKYLKLFRIRDFQKKALQQTTSRRRERLRNSRGSCTTRATTTASRSRRMTRSKTCRRCCANVTKFGEISPISQNLQSLWQNFEATYVLLVKTYVVKGKIFNN